MADVSHNLAMADVSHTQHELFAQQSKSMIYQASLPRIQFQVETIPIRQCRSINTWSFKNWRLENKKEKKIIAF